MSWAFKIGSSIVVLTDQHQQKKPYYGNVNWVSSFDDFVCPEAQEAIVNFTRLIEVIYWANSCLWCSINNQLLVCLTANIFIGFGSYQKRSQTRKSHAFVHKIYFSRAVWRITTKCGSLECKLCALSEKGFSSFKRDRDVIQVVLALSASLCRFLACDCKHLAYISNSSLFVCLAMFLKYLLDQIRRSAVKHLHNSQTALLLAIAYMLFLTRPYLIEDRW